MTIKIIDGNLICTVCGNPIEEKHPYKINEFKFEICCLKCDSETDFSKKCYVPFISPLKMKVQRMIEDITRQYKEFKGNIEINPSMRDKYNVLIFNTQS